MKHRSTLNKIQQVMILSDDIFTRNWISQLIMRDWRTQVAGEGANAIDLQKFFDEETTKFIDVLILDADNFNLSSPTILKTIKTAKPEIKIILISKKADVGLLTLYNESSFGGYLVKNEVEISLAWTVVKAMQGYLVFSKCVEELALKHQISFKKDYIVFDGIEAAEYLSPSENRNARLAFVLSMSRGNLADELSLTPKSSWTLISNLYNQIGMNDLLKGDNWIQFNIEEDTRIFSHLETGSCEKYKTNKHTAKETLAFHIYTKPKMRLYRK